MTLPSTLNACEDESTVSSTSTSSCLLDSASGSTGTALEVDLLQELMLTPDANNNNDSQGGGSVVPQDEDADMFGPPRSAPLLNSNRPRVPMISAKLRLREERKRVLQLCANKLEKIKDSETNLRRSVCINNTFSRLTEEVRREKQSRYLSNLPKNDTRNQNNNNSIETRRVGPCCRLTIPNQPTTTCMNEKCCALQEKEQRVPPLHDDKPVENPPTPVDPTPVRPQRRRSQVESELEALDREIAAINDTMPPIDLEITQGAEQLAQAVVTRKRKRMEASLAENDRLCALSEFYFPSSQADPGHTSLGSRGDGEDLVKRARLLGPGATSNSSLVDFEQSLDDQSQKDFDMIMETLRLTMVDLESKCPGYCLDKASPMAEAIRRVVDWSMREPIIRVN